MFCSSFFGLQISNILRRKGTKGACLMVIVNYLKNYVESADFMASLSAQNLSICVLTALSCNYDQIDILFCKMSDAHI